MIIVGNKKQKVDPLSKAISVDRTSPLGNPFELKVEEYRDRVCEAYEEYFYLVVDKLVEPEIAAKIVSERSSLEIAATWKRPRLGLFLQALSYLKKLSILNAVLVLNCWCFPKRCHAETIVRYLQQSAD